MEKRDLSKRVWLIDEIRGLSIILMVIYHTFYDLTSIFGLNIKAFYSSFLELLVIFFAGMFIFISGTASQYSRNNLKRGLICFGLGMIFTVGTYFIMPESLIQFGILHFLGVCMILFPLIKPLTEKLPPKILIPVLILAFILLYNIPNGFIGISNVFHITLPVKLYEPKLLFWLGFPAQGFFSSDYFPIIPWIFLFIAGGFFGKLLKDNKCPKWVYKPHIKPLAFVGRHTLIIYILHQPVVYLILSIIFYFIK